VVVSRTERRKGQDGELEVAAIFQAAGFDCNRTPNSGGLRITGDLYGDVPCHVEVKRQERLQLPEWLRQAAREAPEGVMPLVAFRQNGREWYAALPLSALVDLLAAAGERDRLLAMPAVRALRPLVAS
jgi:Holliday junction resolvase